MSTETQTSSGIGQSHPAAGHNNPPDDFDLDNCSRQDLAAETRKRLTEVERQDKAVAKTTRALDEYKVKAGIWLVKVQEHVKTYDGDAKISWNKWVANNGYNKDTVKVLLRLGRAELESPGAGAQKAEQIRERNTELKTAARLKAKSDRDAAIAAENARLAAGGAPKEPPPAVLNDALINAVTRLSDDDKAKLVAAAAPRFIGGSTGGVDVLRPAFRASLTATGYGNAPTNTKLLQAIGDATPEQFGVLMVEYLRETAPKRRNKTAAEETAPADEVVS